MRIGVIGCGMMGSGMAKSFAKGHEVLLNDPKKEHVDALAKEIGAKASDYKQLATFSEVIVIAVKNKDLKVVSKRISRYLEKRHFVMSILPGVALEQLNSLFSKPSVFRLMLNLPLLCQRAVVAVADDPTASQEMRARVESVLRGLGTISWIKEELFDAFTVLTSSNPAYIYLVIEAMIQAGVSMGFKPDVALNYLLETFEGSLALIKQTKISPAQLKMWVSSPAGTTIAGLNELEKRGVRAGIIAGLESCYNKTHEFSSLKVD